LSGLHRRKKNIVSNRKAFSSIVGAIFAILIIVSLTGTFFVWSLEQNSRYVNAVADVNQLALDQQNESLNVTSVPTYTVGVGGIVTVSLSVQNDGPITIQLATLWIQDVSGAQPYGFTVLSDVILSPGESWSTPPTVQVNGAISGDSFTGWLISARGSIFPLIVGHLKGDIGEAGAPGANGSQWYVGTSIPSDTLGTDGDFYLNTLTNDVYRKSGGVWSYLTTLAGPAGPAGPQGLPGAGFNDTGTLILLNGTDGSTSYNAATALVSQGIGSVAMNFSEFRTYDFGTSEPPNGTSLSSGIESVSYTIQNTHYYAIRVPLIMMDNRWANISLDKNTYIWGLTPQKETLKSCSWPIMRLGPDNKLYTGDFRIDLQFNKTTYVYFGIKATGFSGSVCPVVIPINILLYGFSIYANGTFTQYGQNLPFIALNVPG
jgi:hypothetical protein